VRYSASTPSASDAAIERGFPTVSPGPRPRLLSGAGAREGMLTSELRPPRLTFPAGDRGNEQAL